MKWIRKLLGLCVHNWEDRGVVSHFWDRQDEHAFKYTMRQRCAKCGAYRQVRY